MQSNPLTPASLSQVEAEVRRRFQAAASPQVLYREAPTVGSDRDIMSFMLEWWTKTGELDSIAVHVNHLTGHIDCYPAFAPAAPADASFTWIDQLLSRVPAS